MNEPRWISTESAILMHSCQIEEFGGSDGLRDRGLLESAMARPKNLFAYGEMVTMSQLAAAYCFGISRNHPFVDGNKRVAYVVARVFLQKNGFDITASYQEKLDTMLALASGKMSDTALDEWFAQVTVPTN